MRREERWRREKVSGGNIIRVVWWEKYGEGRHQKKKELHGIKPIDGH